MDMHSPGPSKGDEFYLVETNEGTDSKVILEDFRTEDGVKGFLKLSFKAAFPQIRNIYKVKVIEEMMPEIPEIELKSIKEVTKE